MADDSTEPCPDQVEPGLDEKTADSTHADDKKKEEILEACRFRDLDALRALAESPGGFISDVLRQQAWPILLGTPPNQDKPEADSPSRESLPPHRDEDQVQLDVNRAFIYYPDNQTPSQLTAQKTHLSTLITTLLRRHPYLCYFQGYHDIAQVLLLLLPPPTLLPSLSRLSLFHLRDFMLPSLSPAITQLRLIPSILSLADPPLARHLSGIEPFFALAGTLTMYAHDLPTLPTVARLFDVLLARHPAFTLYLFAALVRSRREELFEVPREEPEILHSILSKLPAHLDLDALVTDAAALWDKFPPEKLAGWRGVSRWSVLKTGGCVARDGEKEVVPTAEQGRVWFERQVRELVWRKRRERVSGWLWKHRRPVRAVGVAVLVALVAVWLRRGPVPVPVVTGLGYVEALVGMWWR
ncbi:rab-GTPase-TBC domain-containing protein [Staphylotrichum tortipilum]|uniref:Rab-GTPase-TBC domain-containing protein n=1 Tax=Staphylotrichum tortipilum TaxID=2831512 RepID=A0AAN6MR15_9PEZI|nr:rab-GTPase-TBC domain-containing protein [Staphylotrichum longicolle]